MLLSKTCINGIRATLLIAQKEQSEKREFTPIKEIATELNLSFHFLTKILQVLTEANLLRSFRGPNGGVGLALPPQQIRLMDIVSAIDGDAMFSSCILGLPGCGEEKPCPLHNDWTKRRAELRRVFETATIAALAKDIKKNRLRN